MDKLKEELAKRHLTFTALAQSAEISRQTLYNMATVPMLIPSLVKILETLNLPYSEITEDRSATSAIFRNAPSRIRAAVVELSRFCQTHSATLILFGSRARGKSGIQADWDFAVYFPKKVEEKKLILVKEQLREKAFPYRLDIVNLNQAPEWFIESIKDDILVLQGNKLPDSVMQRRAA